MTSGQENALQAGQNYVDTLAFSKAGLIQQLSSSAGDGYSKADATFAANNVDADWNEEAVEAAQNYLDTMPMSQDALIQQLSSSAGDKFTPAQARIRGEHGLLIWPNLRALLFRRRARRSRLACGQASPNRSW